MIQTKALDLDIKKWTGALIMFAFAGVSAFRWQVTGELFFVLLFFRDILASYFLLNRNVSEAKGSNTQALIAYSSSALPLLYFSGSYDQFPETKLVFDLLTIVGFLIVIWATIDLGEKFGVAAAKRGKPCREGIYKYLSHPMYIGYVIAQFGWVLVNRENLPIYTLSLILMFTRARSEEEILRRRQR